MNFLAKYARRVLAAHMPGTPIIELLQRPWFKGPPGVPVASGSGQFAGRTALNSGTGVVTISTAMIKSGMNVLAMMQLNSAAAVSSGTPFPQFVVNSIVDNVSFTIGFADAIGRAPGGVIMWELRRTS